MISIIPLEAIPNKTTSCKIPVDGQNLLLLFTLTYNELAKYWVVEIKNSNGKSLVSALPVIPAENILEQFKYLKIGSAYILPRQTVKEEWPSYETLNSNWYLVWSDTDG